MLLTSSSLQFLNCGPGHIQCKYSSAYSGVNIQLNVSALILEISRQFNVPYTANLVPIQRTTSSWRNVNFGPGHIQWHYTSTYSLFNIQLNVAPLLLEIFRQFSECYTANMVPNTAHILQLTLSELWSRTYTMWLQLLIFRLQYSIAHICADIGYVSTIRYALYCKHCAKYSAYPPDYAMWIVVPGIYNVITTPLIQDSIFIWTYLRRYWRYIDNSMRLILQRWCQIQRTSSGLRYLDCGPRPYTM
jgi:hypothetical protein